MDAKVKGTHVASPKEGEFIENHSVKLKKSVYRRDISSLLNMQSILVKNYACISFTYAAYYMQHVFIG